MVYKQYVYNFSDRLGKKYQTNENDSYPKLSVENNKIWTKLGIQGETGLQFMINNSIITLGFTRVYELDNCNIYSFSILDDQADNIKNIIIDYREEDLI